MDQQDNFEILERNSFKILIIKGNLPEKPPSNFTESVKDLITNPTNLCINCFLAKNLPEKWLNNLSVMHSLLPIVGRKVCFMHIPTELNSYFENVKFKNLTQVDNLKQSLELFEDFIGVPKKISFIKAFMSSLIEIFYFESSLSVVKHKIFIQTTQEKNYLGKYTGFFTASTQHYFYNISISFSQEFFDKIVTDLVKNKKSKSDKDIIGLLTKKIIEKAKSLGINQTALDISEVQTLLETDSKPEVVMWKESEWSLKKDVITIIVPFSSNYGDFYVETCIPKDFNHHILKTMSEEN